MQHPQCKNPECDGGVIWCDCTLPEHTERCPTCEDLWDQQGSTPQPPAPAQPTS